MSEKRSTLKKLKSSSINNRSLLNKTNASKRNNNVISSSVPKIYINNIDVTPSRFIGIEKSGANNGKGESNKSILNSSSFDMNMSNISSSKLSFNMDMSNISNKNNNNSDTDTDDDILPTYQPESNTENIKIIKKLTESQLDELITIELHETETITLLNIPGLCVWTEDTNLHSDITEKNLKYKNLIDTRSTKDIYSNRSAQTFNMPVKDKDVSAIPSGNKEFGANITTWDIYDSYIVDLPETKSIKVNTVNTGTHSIAVGGDDDFEEEESSANEIEQSFVNSTLMGKSNSEKSSGGNGGTITDYSNIQDPKKLSEVILKLDSFKEACKLIERAITQNELHAQQMLYRHSDVQTAASKSEGVTNILNELYPPESGSASPVSPDITENIISNAASVNPSVSFLWTFSCEETKGRTVSSMDWNKLNQDMLATGYGQFDFGSEQNGLIALWTLKNPGYPERLIYTKHGVSSVDFSSTHPHLLAAGFNNGSTAIYDIRTGDKPVLESTFSAGKHSESIMDFRWLVNGDDHSSHHLTSISTDASVKQWNMKKGLVPLTIMTLKRVANQAQSLGSTHGDGVVSRTCGGLCFDFPFNDTTQYFCGTEDGIIHKCSVSYNDQVLESYFGHLGPVYKTRCSPFYSDAFLTCSADWTIRLWNQKSSKPICTFQSGLDYVMDIGWSPFNSSVFGSVSRDGRIEVWNLEKNTLDPYIRVENPNKSYSTFTFCRNSPILVTGDTSGNVDVYKLNGVEDRSNMGRENQAKFLQDKMTEEENK